MDFNRSRTWPQVRDQDRTMDLISGVTAFAYWYGVTIFRAVIWKYWNCLKILMTFLLFLEFVVDDLGWPLQLTKLFRTFLLSLCQIFGGVAKSRQERTLFCDKDLLHPLTFLVHLLQMIDSFLYSKTLWHILSFLILIWLFLSIVLKQTQVYFVDFSLFVLVLAQLIVILDWVK